MLHLSMWLFKLEQILSKKNLKFDRPEPEITKPRKYRKGCVRLWFNQNPNNYRSYELMLSYVSKGHHRAKVLTRVTELAVVALLICKCFKTLGTKHSVENTHIFSSDQLRLAVKASRVLHAWIKPPTLKFGNLSNPMRN